MSKFTMLVAAGVGYVLGTRDGRERYEQLKGYATQVRNNPRVQEKTQQAADLAREKAPLVKDRVADAASAAKEKVSSSDSPDTPENRAKLNPESTALQEDPYPKGNLP